ncbi:MAG: undecaprenyl-phosphate glucose phosphotransferase [Ignavibacteria bacterium]
MNKQLERTVLVVSDLLAFSLSWFVYYYVRVRSGWIDVTVVPELWLPMVFIDLYWLLLFFVVGLYRPWYAKSRLDEIALLFKTTLAGCLFLFFAVFVDDAGTNVQVSSRLLIVIYWGILFSFVAIGRLTVRSLQRRMLIAGIGTHNTLIVGSEKKCRELFDEVVQYPALGYRVVGCATITSKRAKPYRGIPVLGVIEDLPRLISQHNIKDVLIALESSDHARLLEIIHSCNSHSVGLKIMPDLYDIISGQARTNQIYGFPLIEISPQIMPPWEEAMKRVLDVSFAFVVLVLGMPLWLFIALLIKLDSPGPVLYKQERVGKEGKVFNILKFRSMYLDAEKAGPQWAERGDPRVTRVGAILRKLHLDEVPQMWNVLKGDMSLVGPRPERPMFVEKLSQEIPLYARRLRVRPGITGWAQVKHKYDESVEDVKKKIQYDLFYIENMSLRMDFKIILNTIAHMLLGKGHT